MKMMNIHVEGEGNERVIVVEIPAGDDHLQQIGAKASASGKSYSIGSTGGNQSVPIDGVPGVKLGVNCYLPADIYHSLFPTAAANAMAGAKGAAKEHTAVTKGAPKAPTARK